MMSTASRAWRGGRADWKLHILSAFSLAVAFVCLGAALLIVVNINAVRERWTRAGRATIYLQDGATEQMISKLPDALRQTPGVTSVRYVSQADARQEVVGLDDDGPLAALPADAFPASVEIGVSSNIDDAEVAKIIQRLSELPTVESVETYQRHTNKLRHLLTAGMVASSVLALVVFAAVVSVVASTVRIAMQRRHVEVEVLRLVGATDQYVRRPFVLEGGAQGAVGAAGAVLLLGILYLIVSPHAQGVLTLLLGVSPSFLPWHTVLGLVASGGVLGAVASHLSLRRMMAA